MAPKKTPKNAKVISGELNKLQFLENTNIMNTRKRSAEIEAFEDEDISELIRQSQAIAKKKKADTICEANPEFRKKILDLVNNQLEDRKQFNENLYKSLSELTAQVEEDYNTMKENEQKLEHLTGIYMNCLQESSKVFKAHLNFDKILDSFKEKCVKVEADDKTEKVVAEVEHDIKKVQDKLVAQTKKSLCLKVFNAMRNSF